MSDHVLLDLLNESFENDKNIGSDQPSLELSF